MQKNLIKKILKQILKIFYIFPLNRKKIFIINFQGTSYGADPKYFLEYSNENNLGYKFIWGCKEKKYFQNYNYKNVRFVKLMSFRGVYHVLTSRIFFYNINPISFIPYRKKQILINSWHGLALKKVGKYASDFDEKQFNLTTCFLSNSGKYTEWVIRESFNYKKEIYSCGMPRNDVFFNSKKVSLITNDIKKKYNIVGKKILLFAPTFRGYLQFEEIDLDFLKIKKNLKEKFGGDWVVFFRLHPMIAEKYCVDNPNIINVSLYQDMQELLCACDILLTDYSSSMFDFCLLKRPIFIFADDIVSYQNEDRGFYINPYDLPFDIATNQEILLENIQKFNYNNYITKLNKFTEFMEFYDDGKGSEKVFEYILSKTMKNNKNRK